jgi:Pup amidohydrolase
VKHLIPFFVSRQIFTGSGKVGAENSAEKTDYQISQRADFFEVEVGLETTFKRPIINTRDEPHADPERFRRLHVIVGDANMAELPVFLKIGTTSLLLQMIEDDFIADDMTLADPMRAMRSVSHDPTCRTSIETVEGASITAVELQWEYLKLAKKYASENESSDVSECVLEEWERILEGLERDPMSLSSDLDWVAKLSLLRAYRERDALDWEHPKLRLIDLQYHEVRRDRSLYWKLAQSGKISRLVTDAEIDNAVDRPPEDTRAYFRGECLRRFSPRIAAASWDSLIFDIGDDALRKVPTMDPTRGTRALVGDLLAGCADAPSLVERLSS